MEDIQRFSKGNLEFLCSVSQEPENKLYYAKVLKINSSDQKTELIISGSNKDDTYNKLKKQIENTFTLGGDEITSGKILKYLIDWIWYSRGGTQRFFRIFVSVLLFILIGLSFVDLSSNESTFGKNISFFRSKLSGNINPSGFMNEDFYSKCLSEAKQRFWITGVSLRSICKGNRKFTIEALKRKIDFKMVLLNPKSALANDSCLQNISRTAKRKDIEETINSFTSKDDGLFNSYPDASKHQLWIAEMAPIIPMVVVDDNIYVSYLFQVDKERANNAFNAPYWAIKIDSDMGQRLLKHFNDLIENPTSKILYPAAN